jgi:hypothetical protein
MRRQEMNSLGERILPEWELGARSWVTGRVEEETTDGAGIPVAERGGDGRRRRHGGAQRRRVVGAGERDDRCGWNRPPLKAKASTGR